MILRYYPQIHFYIHFWNQNSRKKFLNWIISNYTKYIIEMTHLKLATWVLYFVKYEPYFLRFSVHKKNYKITYDFNVYNFTYDSNRWLKNLEKWKILDDIKSEMSLSELFANFHDYLRLCKSYLFFKLKLIWNRCHFVPLYQFSLWPWTIKRMLKS